MSEDFVHNHRPQSFKDFIGQQNITEQIEVMIQSATLRNKPIDHMIFSGPPGLGKTSLGMLIGKAQSAQFHFISAPAIEKKADLAMALAGLGAGDILFIDEIHRLPSVIEEVLYSAMEDFRLDIIMGAASGQNAKMMKIDLAPFTLIGATTQLGRISRPLRDRFIASFTLDYYNPSDLQCIIEKYFNSHNIHYELDAIALMAACARGTPRVALKLAVRMRDYCLVEQCSLLDLSMVKNVLKKLHIHTDGLDNGDMKFLKVLHEQFLGGPVGLNVLSMALGQERFTLEEVIEPFLLLKGYIIRTPRGRMLSKLGEDMCRLIS